MSVEDVRSLSGIPEFQSNPEWEKTRPQASPDTPEPCRAVYDQPTVFGTDWRQFRSVVYSASIDHPTIPEIASVAQTIAVYPDHAAAEAAFDRLHAAIPLCAKANIEFYSKTPQRPDPSTITLSGDEASYVYRLTQSALVYASATGSFDTAHVTHEIAESLTNS